MGSKEMVKTTTAKEIPSALIGTLTATMQGTSAFQNQEKGLQGEVNVHSNSEMAEPMMLMSHVINVK